MACIRWIFKDTDMQAFKGLKEELPVGSIQLHGRIHKPKISISFILGIGLSLILTRFLHLQVSFQYFNILFNSFNCFSTCIWKKRIHCYFDCVIQAINSFVLVVLACGFENKWAFLRNWDIKFWIANLLAFKNFNSGNNFHVNIDTSN